jgi:hypothetical protein
MSAAVMHKLTGWDSCCKIGVSTGKVRGRVLRESQQLDILDSCAVCALTFPVDKES